MMGGRRFTFFSDIPIGADVRRTSEVLSSVEKNGRSGRFMIRTTRTLIYVGGAKEPALQEDFDTLFRAPASESAGAEASPAPVERPADLESTSGRGLLLVSELATAWGYDRSHGEKCTWAEVDLNVT